MAMISRYGEPYGGFDKIQAIDYNKTNESKADLSMPTIKKTFGGVIFEWDNDKELLNIKNHDVTFDEALSVLLCDDFAQTNEDIRDYNGEQRFITLGMSNLGRLLYVVWTQRDVHYRMISARKANKHEQKGYRNGQRF